MREKVKISRDWILSYTPMEITLNYVCGARMLYPADKYSI